MGEADCVTGVANEVIGELSECLEKALEDSSKLMELHGEALELLVIYRQALLDMRSFVDGDLESEGFDPDGPLLAEIRSILERAGF